MVGITLLLCFLQLDSKREMSAEESKKYDSEHRPDLEYCPKRPVSWQTLGECVLFIHSRNPGLVRFCPDDFVALLSNELDKLLRDSAAKLVFATFKVSYSLHDALAKLQKLVMSTILLMANDHVRTASTWHMRSCSLCCCRLRPTNLLPKTRYS